MCDRVWREVIWPAERTGAWMHSHAHPQNCTRNVDEALTRNPPCSGACLPSSLSWRHVNFGRTFVHSLYTLIVCPRQVAVFRALFCKYVHTFVTLRVL